MKIDWALLANFLIAMLAIVNPVEKIPLWVEASAGKIKNFQWMLAGLVIGSCALILLLFLWFGEQILSGLKVQLESFKIGGGLILLQFGFSMMKGTAVLLERAGSDDDEKLASRVLRRYRQIFIPIGVPVIAGPGAITTVIIYGSQSDSFMTSVSLSLVVVVVLIILFFTLLTGPFIQRMIGQLPLDLMSRVFGMILIAIAVQFMVEGLAGVFPALTATG